MCGRYMLDSDIEDILQQYKILNGQVDYYDKGDIYPSQKAPIVLGEEDRVLKFARWGFPITGKRKLVINARSETIDSKPIFKNSFIRSRCIIPANLFYEWKDQEHNNKVKHRIYLKEKGKISLAGLFKFTLDDGANMVPSFVIITTEANKYMKDLHSRMPLIIAEDSIDSWLGRETSKSSLEDIIKSNASRQLKIDIDDQGEPFKQLRMDL